MKLLGVMILALALATEAIADDRTLKARFGPLYEKFGENSTTKVEVVSGPRDNIQTGRQLPI